MDANTLATISAVAMVLDREGIRFTVTGGQRTKREDWDCFAWNVELHKPGGISGGASYPSKRVRFDYYTGTGLVKARSKAQADKYSWQYRDPVPETPAACAVLHALLLDSAARDMSFTDWCSDYGYSTDSISALNTYQACSENADKLRSVLSAPVRAELAELLKDY